MTRFLLLLFVLNGCAYRSPNANVRSVVTISLTPPETQVLDALVRP